MSKVLSACAASLGSLVVVTLFLPTCSFAAAPSSAAVSHPADWIKKPNAETISDFYPTRANQLNVEGSSSIKCKAKTDHRLHDCIILSETPPGYGFGEAAIRASSTFELRPAIENGVEQGETEVTVPLRWTLDRASVPRVHWNPFVLLFALPLIGLLLWGAWRLKRAMDIRVDPFMGRLLSGERVIWSGQPATGLIFTPRDFLLVPCSALWLSFAIFWTVAVSFTRAGWFAAFGLIFVFLGIFALIGRFWFDTQLRRGIRYALTNRRVLISRPKPFGEFTALVLDRLPDARLAINKSGRGTIRFGQPASLLFSYNGFSTWVPALDPTPQFLAIEDPERVFDLVQRSGGTVA